MVYPPPLRTAPFRYVLRVGPWGDGRPLVTIDLWHDGGIQRRSRWSGSRGRSPRVDGMGPGQGQLWNAHFAVSMKWSWGYWG